MSSRWPLFLTLFVLLAAAIRAEDGAPLFRALRVGLKIHYKHTRKTVTETEIDSTKDTGKTKGKEKSLEIREQEFVETVLGIQDDGHLLERVYSNSTSESAKGPSLPKKPGPPERTALHGKTLYLYCKGPAVTLQVRNGTLQGEEEGDLKFLEQLYRLLPPNPVKPGDAWEPDGDKFAAVLFAGMYDPTNFKSKVKCGYKGTEKLAGRTCAKVQVQLTIDVAAFGEVPEVHQEVGGTFLVTLDNAVILGYDLTGPFRYKGRSKGGDGSAYSATAEGVRTIMLRGEILDEGGDLSGGTLVAPPDPK